MLEIVFKMGHFKRGLSKSLNKANLIFFSNPISFNEQDHKNKRRLKLMSSHSSGYKTSSDKFLYETVELSTLTHLFD